MSEVILLSELEVLRSKACFLVSLSDECPGSHP